MSDDLGDALKAARSFIHEQHPPNSRMALEKLLEAVELIALRKRLLEATELIALRQRRGERFFG